VAATVAINDRWGKETRGVHGGYHTTEYGLVHDEEATAATSPHPFEECRGIGHSFGYNRAETLSDYQSPRELIHLLIDLVSRGGNLLLDIGPTADGRIPVIMEERLLQIGAWLERNGEAIYGTRPWRVSKEGDGVRFTAKGDTLYVICLDWPGRELKLTAPQPAPGTTARLLGLDAQLPWTLEAGGLRIELPDDAGVPASDAYVIKLTSVR
jgi:alpha-L-fucosidase